jgi:hypothetical protein
MAILGLINWTWWCHPEGDRDRWNRTTCDVLSGLACPSSHQSGLAAARLPAGQRSGSGGPVTVPRRHGAVSARHDGCLIVSRRQPDMVIAAGASPRAQRQTPIN